MSSREHNLPTEHERSREEDGPGAGEGPSAGSGDTPETPGAPSPSATAIRLAQELLAALHVPGGTGSGGEASRSPTAGELYLGHKKKKKNWLGEARQPTAQLRPPRADAGCYKGVPLQSLSTRKGVKQGDPASFTLSPHLLSLPPPPLCYSSFVSIIISEVRLMLTSPPPPLLFFHFPHPVGLMGEMPSVHWSSILSSKCDKGHALPCTCSAQSFGWLVSSSWHGSIARIMLVSVRCLGIQVAISGNHLAGNHPTWACMSPACRGPK